MRQLLPQGGAWHHQWMLKVTSYRRRYSANKLEPGSAHDHRHVMTWLGYTGTSRRDMQASAQRERENEGERETKREMETASEREWESKKGRGRGNERREVWGWSWDKKTRKHGGVGSGLVTIGLFQYPLRCLVRSRNTLNPGYLDPVSIYKNVFQCIGINSIKIRRLWDCKSKSMFLAANCCPIHAVYFLWHNLTINQSRSLDSCNDRNTKNLSSNW